MRSLRVLPSEPLLDVFPEIYRGLLPAELALEVPREELATCLECPMTSETEDLEGAVAMSPGTKCCTYQPVLPNYLVGALLRDRDPRLDEGRSRVRARIAQGAGVTPLALRPPPKLELLYGSLQKGNLGRAPSLLCGYFEPDRGLCTIWRFREATCSTFFCKHVTGQNGQAFWREVYSFLKRTELLLARHALEQIAPELVGSDERVSAQRGAPLTAEDVEGMPPPEEERALRWLSFRGREEEMYIAAFEAVRSLDRPAAERILGKDGRARVARVGDLAEASARPRVPARLVRAPALSTRATDEGHVAVTGYSTYDPLALPLRLFDALDALRGDEDLEPQLARIRDEHRVSVDADTILTLYEHGILVPP